MSPAITKAAVCAASIMLSACAGPEAIAEAAPCVDLKSSGSTAVFEGRLTVQLFAGPPNYESIAAGDAEERALILELPERECVVGDDFIESGSTFDRVHVSSMDDALLDVLAASVGREVKIEGEAFGSHTGHHHAPLVLMAEKVSVR